MKYQNYFHVLILGFYLCFFSFHLAAQTKSFYELSAKTIDGQVFDFKKLKGKKIVIVNIATGCSLAPQLYKLAGLYIQHEKYNFEILAFPSNDFGNHENHDNEQIEAICRQKYGIKFPVMEKTGIRNNVHPVYKWLTSKSENGASDYNVIWNYQKFLVDTNGNIKGSLLPVVSPLSSKITGWLFAE